MTEILLNRFQTHTQGIGGESTHNFPTREHGKGGGHPHTPQPPPVLRLLYPLFFTFSSSLAPSGEESV